MIIKYEPNQDNFILTVKYGHRKKYIYIIKKNTIHCNKRIPHGIKTSERSK